MMKNGSLGYFPEACSLSACMSVSWQPSCIHLDRSVSSVLVCVVCILLGFLTSLKRWHGSDGSDCWMFNDCF
jgi:hypothetical protein